MKKINLALIVLLLIYFTSCSSIPKKEIDDAEMAIQESEKINANKYAPEQLNAAKEDLETAKQKVIDSNNKEAKKQAISAKNKAMQAYFLSIAEFTKDTQQGLDLSMQTAKDAHSDTQAPNKFNEAKSLYNEIQKEMEDLKNLEAKLKDNKKN